MIPLILSHTHIKKKRLAFCTVFLFHLILSPPFFLLHYLYVFPFFSFFLQPAIKNVF
ncbi:hypothetical protein BCR42DRAFT_409714 [Absidia repens]|uniref:Uncharacterized protein n=1 Tax=Absidia repens TaxID=90262 RepID=A0A1X2IN07_9FUNG|nr:hypothetical protein BCR42DRAFT_409714 [Absidia repens]